jgi:hypothetical protein
MTLALVPLLALAAACAPAKHNKPVDASRLPVDTPSFPTPTATVTLAGPPTTGTATSASASASASASVSLHPVPSAPLRTVTVHAAGRQYVISIWAEQRDTDCADHSYGQVQIFLQINPCSGMIRRLATTTVNGRTVGFADASVNIPTADSAHPYRSASAFRQLVDKDGTGSINDLMREGWRLPSGPTAVPSTHAFRTLAQDSGVDIFDIWYLQGATPDNDPPLLQLAADIYLQY